LKAVNFNKNGSGDILETDQDSNGFSTLSKLYQPQLKSRRLDVLFNLCNFRSCEIKSVNFQNVFKFAIKLVPFGYLRPKKLYLLPDIADSYTEWCGILTGFIAKPTHSSSVSDDKKATTTYATLQIPKKEETPHFTAASSQDLYISLDENDAYESSSQS